MAEELKEASDIKKLIGKNKGEEDPILVAQRFLNIFRQLHIFDQQRREEFNSMILALPPEIRGTFGVLPGGSVLQEYVDELEISKGMAKSSGTVPQPKSLVQPEAGETKDSPLSRIKNTPQPQAAAVAPQVITGEAKIVADASFAQVLSQSVSSALMAASASQSSNLEQVLNTLKDSSGGSGKIVPDEKFAASMAQAFSQALQFSDASKKADIQELIKAVRESRKIEFPEGFSFGNAPTAAAPAIVNETSFAKNIAEAITKVLKPGTVPQTAASAASDADMKELIKAVRESNGIDVEALSKALVSGLKPLLSNIGGHTSEKQQQIKVSADENFSEIITGALTKTFEISEKKRQEQTERLISGFQDVMRKDKAEKLIADFQKVLQTNPPADGSAPIAAPVFASGAFSGGSEQFEKITQEFTKTLRSLNDSRKSESREIAQAIKETQKELLKLLTQQNNKDTGKDKKREAPQPQSAEMINEIITKVAQAQSNIFQELAKQQTSELSTIISLALKESQKSSVETIVDTFKRLQENNIQVNFPVYQAIPQKSGRSPTRKRKKFAITEPLTATEDDDFDEPVLRSGKSYIQKSVEASLKKEENQPQEFSAAASTRDTQQDVAEYIKSEFEPLPLDEPEKISGSDWGFATEEPAAALSSSEEAIQADISPVDAPSTENGETSQASDEEWEWEYEEAPAESDTDGVEGQDWEWEYEDGGDAQGLEGQDWEWEYEDGSQDDLQGVEGEDWEWEYEEEDDTESDTSPALAASGTAKEASEADNPPPPEAEGNDTSETPAETEAEQPPAAQGMSSAALLAAVKAQKTPPIKMEAPEIVIAELRNNKNKTDPYLSSNIGV